MQMGVGGVKFSGKKRYKGVRFNVISVTRGWVGVKFSEKKHYKGVRFNVISVTRGWVGSNFQKNALRNT